MRCNYCGRNYFETDEIKNDLNRHGCYACGGSDFSSEQPTIKVNNKTYLAVTSGSYLSNRPITFASVGLGGARDNQIDYSVSSGSTGYFNGEYKDFSGFYITEAEYTENQMKHYPGYPRSHAGWDELPDYVPLMVQSIRSGYKPPDLSSVWLRSGKKKKHWLLSLISGD